MMYKQKLVQTTTVMVVLALLVGSLQFAMAADENSSVNLTNTGTENETMQTTAMNDTNSSNASASNTSTNSTSSGNVNTTVSTNASSSNNSASTNTTVTNTNNADNSASTPNTTQNTTTQKSSTKTQVNTNLNTNVNNDVTTVNGNAYVNTNVNNNVNTKVKNINVQNNNTEEVSLLKSIDARLEGISQLVSQILGRMFGNNTTGNNSSNMTNVTNITVPANNTNNTHNNTNVNLNNTNSTVVNNTVVNTTNTTVRNNTVTNTTVNNSSTNTNTTVTNTGGLDLDDQAIAASIDRGVGWVLNRNDNSFARFASLGHSFVDTNESIEQGDHRHEALLLRFDGQTYRFMMNASKSNENTKVFGLEAKESLGTLTLNKRFELGNFETWTGAFNTGNATHNLGFAVIHREFQIEVEPDRGPQTNESVTLMSNNIDFQQELNRIASADIDE